MSTRVVLRILGFIWLSLGTLLLVYLISSQLFGSPVTTRQLALRAALLLVIFGCGTIFVFSTSHQRHQQVQTLSPRAAILSVLLVWCSLIGLGALPYIWQQFSFADAIFEAASGFSTTGATILNDIESLPAPLLLWRSFSQWLGGMGIVVLFVAFFPSLGISGKRLFSHEMPGPLKESFTPQLKDTTRQLWLIYISFTVLLAGILKAMGLSFFDAINHALTTLATGGFSTKNASVGAFSAAVQWIIALFMLLGGLNFTLYMLLLTSRRELILRDIEVRWYLTFVIGLSIIVMLLLMIIHHYSLPQAARFAFFTVISLTTTTGYTNIDYESFAMLIQALLFLTFFTGGSAGSTSGGMKFYRIVLFFKALSIELKHAVLPRAVEALSIGTFHVPALLVSKVFIFICVYFLSVLAFCFILWASGVDFFTAFAAAASSIGNVGPAFGNVGPAETYAHLSVFAKLVCSLAMIIGRLEFFTFLTVLHPRFWRR